MFVCFFSPTLLNWLLIKTFYSCITISMVMVLEFVCSNPMEFHVVDLENIISFL